VRFYALGIIVAVIASLLSISAGFMVGMAIVFVIFSFCMDG
jgi:uncharacterized membrane protein AbrB (regulator of aidB expression)